jgi:hypothetical protein
MVDGTHESLYRLPVSPPGMGGARQKHSVNSSAGAGTIGQVSDPSDIPTFPSLNDGGGSDAGGGNAPPGAPELPAPQQQYSQSDMILQVSILISRVDDAQANVEQNGLSTEDTQKQEEIKRSNEAIAKATKKLQEAKHKHKILGPLATIGKIFASIAAVALTIVTGGAAAPAAIAMIAYTVVDTTLTIASAISKAAGGPALGLSDLLQDGFTALAKKCGASDKEAATIGQWCAFGVQAVVAIATIAVSVGNVVSVVKGAASATAGTASAAGGTAAIAGDVANNAGNAASAAGGAADTAGTVANTAGDTASAAGEATDTAGDTTGAIKATANALETDVETVEATVKTVEAIKTVEDTISAVEGGASAAEGTASATGSTAGAAGGGASPAGNTVSANGGLAVKMSSTAFKATKMTGIACQAIGGATSVSSGGLSISVAVDANDAAKANADKAQYDAVTATITEAIRNTLDRLQLIAADLSAGMQSAAQDISKISETNLAIAGGNVSMV